MLLVAHLSPIGATLPLNVGQQGNFERFPFYNSKFHLLWWYLFLEIWPNILAWTYTYHVSGMAFSCVLFLRPDNYWTYLSSFWNMWLITCQIFRFSLTPHPSRHTPRLSLRVSKNVENCIFRVCTCSDPIYSWQQYKLVCFDSFDFSLHWWPLFHRDVGQFTPVRCAMYVSSCCKIDERVVFENSTVDKTKAGLWGWGSASGSKAAYKFYFSPRQYKRENEKRSIAGAFACPRSIYCSLRYQ